MVDTLLHHYQRLWKVEATAEISITRQRPKRPKSRVRPASTAAFSSLNNLCHSPYLPKNIVPKKDSTKRSSTRQLRSSRPPEDQHHISSSSDEETRNVLTRQLSITRMISKEETKANPDLELMRSKSQSLHDLKRKVTEDDNNPKPMADKIDDFLQTVNQQQEALNKLLEERRRHKGSQLKGTRRTSSLAQRLSTPTLQATLQTTNRKAKNN
eukprot:02765.XXX_40699_40000_1 [CDS] Oithona nana genome sequencing.